MPISTKPRQPPSKPIHYLLDTLRDLQIRMQHTGGHSDSMNILEAYDYFTRESNKGRACSHAIKCRSTFCKQDYYDIKTLLERALHYYQEVEKEKQPTSREWL